MSSTTEATSGAPPAVPAGRRLVCAARFRPTGTAEALSSTPDLPAVAALLAAAGCAAARRASDVGHGPDGWTPVVRSWVGGRPAPLGAHPTKAAAVAAEVAYLTRALGLAPASRP